jgi:thiamine-phosphate pyrophosphorylase
MTLARLLVLTDRHQVPAGRTLADVLAAVADGGATCVLLRESDLPDDERAALAAVAHGRGLSVIAAHRPVPGGAGVHVRATDPTPAGGRWGRSCHDRVEVDQAAREGAAWVTLSPFAPTASKPGHGPPLAASAYAGLPVPTYALGGIGPANAAAARAAGAHGVAVMGAVMRAPDPAVVVAALLEVVA